MSNARTCPNCGGPLPDDILDGLCPRCVAGVALATSSDEKARGPLTEEPRGESTPAQNSSEPVIPDHEPGDRIGRHKLLQRLGEGGMGSVWMAEQTEPVRRTVALKVIKAGMDCKEVLARFEAERQALALMDHPNIARILDAGVVGQRAELRDQRTEGGSADSLTSDLRPLTSGSGRPYFVMDLVKGIPLIRFCDDQRLSVRERLELFMQVCQAIQHAHQKGIIHRDLKPSNVLVALYDGKPVPKVIDFGLAKAMGQRLTERTLCTQLGSVVGTLEYMSPEQAELNQLDIDTRSDIYSLGVLLYELLTGTTPLTRGALRQAALDEVLKRIREEEPPKPSLRLSTSREQLPAISAARKLDPDKLTKVVRGELDWIVMRALEKDRNRRYETANGFALDIQHYLNDEPVAAGPPTARYRVKKFVRKHRQVVAVAVGFALVVAFGFAGVTWKWREAERQRERAEEARSEMQIQRAEDLFGTDDSARALAHLAGVLRRDRSNPVAAQRQMSALTHQSFALPITQLLRYNDFMTSALFSPDGQRVVTASSDKTARVWDVPSASSPVPEWLVDMAEVLGGERLNELGVTEPAHAAELLRLKRQLADESLTGSYSGWIKGFFADRSTRTISPFSSITVPEYVQRRIQQNTLESLQEAVQLSPTNGLAFGRLAKQVLAQNDEDNPRRVGEADFFSRYALKWSPKDAEVAKMRAEIGAQIQRLKTP